VEQETKIESSLGWFLSDFYVGLPRNSSGLLGYLPGCLHPAIASIKSAAQERIGDTAVDFIFLLIWHTAR